MKDNARGDKRASIRLEPLRRKVLKETNQTAFSVLADFQLRLSAFLDADAQLVVSGPRHL